MTRTDELQQIIDKLRAIEDDLRQINIADGLAHVDWKDRVDLTYRDVHRAIDRLEFIVNRNEKGQEVASVG
jgi:predicted N-formylglutamate amidohydrolase